MWIQKFLKALFLKVNNELHKINQWLISNKLSLNIKKVSLLLSKLKINNCEIKRQNQLNFLVFC